MFSTCLLFACQARASQPPSPTPSIEARDAKGGVDAELRTGHPCRARIGPIELQIGGPPLVALLGETRLTGMAGDGGTTLASDGQTLVRLQPSSDRRELDVFDASGNALVRIVGDGTGASIQGATRHPLHHVAAKGDDFVFDDGVGTVHGTHDAVLAALLLAPELLPEVRMLAACERAWNLK